jgi:glutamine amidotransferase
VVKSKIMIAIVDYGMGNIRSVEKGFLKVGADAKVTSDPKVISDSKGIVLPGVGAFRDCMKNLDDLKLLDAVVKEIHKGKPYLGICLGMQILFSESEEFGVCKGLDIFKGKVVKFRFDRDKQQNLKIPHMGWNTVKLNKRPPIFNGIEDDSYFYFVHSYYVVPDALEVTAGITSYGIDFTSMVCKDNVFATQFHPEKSQDSGLRILKGFSEFVSKA